MYTNILNCGFKLSSWTQSCLGFADNQCGVGAEGVKDSSKLNSDVASTHHYRLSVKPHSVLGGYQSPFKLMCKTLKLGDAIRTMPSMQPKC